MKNPLPDIAFYVSTILVVLLTVGMFIVIMVAGLCAISSL